MQSSTQSLSQETRHSVLSYFNYTLDSDLLKLVDTDSPMNVLHTNCSLPQKMDNCSYTQFEALLNLADRTVCRCDNSKLSVGNWCKAHTRSLSGSKVTAGVTVFAVTPTYSRYTQKVDLTSLCHTLQHVPDLVWIVVEDSVRKTSLVADLLQRCEVRGGRQTEFSLYMHVYTIARV